MMKIILESDSIFCITSNENMKIIICNGHGKVDNLNQIWGYFSHHPRWASKSQDTELRRCHEDLVIWPLDCNLIVTFPKNILFISGIFNDKC